MTLERNSKLVNRKFIQYLIPSILMVFAMQFGSLIDGILVGNMIGSEALSATALVVPTLYFIQLPGFALGVGGSIVIANLLGKRDVIGAKKAFSISIVIGMGVSLIFAAIAFLVARPLASLFSDDLIEYSYQYILGYLLTDPLITFALLLGSFMAVDNNPRLSSILFISANVAKVLLEILFIYTFGEWATFGAAISTGCGYLVGSIAVIFYVLSKKRNLSFSLKLKNTGLKEVLKSSSTSALNFALTAIQMLIVNIFIGRILTIDYELAVYGLVANMVFLFDLCCGGILNIIPTICGIFYGEKDYYSLKKLTNKIFILNLIVTGVLMALIAIFPNIYALVFGYDDPANYEFTSLILRIYVISFLPYAINKFSMSYYPSIDKNMPSIITVLSRELVVVLPVTLSLLFAYKLQGYVIASSIVEITTVIATFAFVLIYQKVKKKKSKGIFMIEKEEVKSFDVSFDNELANASVISEQLIEFALKNGVKNREAQMIGLAAEEIVSNIVTYGYKKGKTNYIDVNLRLVSDNLILRIRDDGHPFDPTKYEFDSNEEYSTSGIKLIMGIADNMSYMRVLSLNNTVFEIKMKE